MSITPQEADKVLFKYWEENKPELYELVSTLVKEAHIAGAESTKGIGLNLSKEERAAQYCKEKGLRS